MRNRKNSRMCYRTKTPQSFSSDAPPSPALARTLWLLASGNSNLTASVKNNMPILESQYQYCSATDLSLGARIAPCRSDYRMAYPHSQNQKILQRPSFQVPSIGECTNLPQCHELDDSSVVRHLSKPFLIKPSRAPLHAVTIFSLQYSSQRILLPWMNPQQLTTIALAKYSF